MKPQPYELWPPGEPEEACGVWTGPGLSGLCRVWTGPGPSGPREVGSASPGSQAWCLGPAKAHFRELSSGFPQNRLYKSALW